MKIAYQVLLGDPVIDSTIGRNAWFSDAEKAMTESYFLMERMEEKYGSFLIWDAGIPFKSNKDQSKIVVLEGDYARDHNERKPFLFTDQSRTGSRLV